ncbi:MAG: hypothetical protein ACK4ND_13740, partial [Cytophagaceae bacterium]
MSFQSHPSPNFPETEDILNQRLKKWLKFQLLMKMSLLNGDSLEEKEILSKEKESRTQVIKSEKRRINKILKHPSGYEDYISLLFFNSI